MLSRPCPQVFYFHMSKLIMSCYHVFNTLNGIKITKTYFGINHAFFVQIKKFPQKWKSVHIVLPFTT